MSKQTRFKSLMPPMPRLAKVLTLGVVAASSLWIADSGFAESLWQKRNQRGSNLFVDTRARQVGDLIIVQIREVTGVDENDERKLEKKTDADGTFSFEGKSSANAVARSAAASLTANNESNRTLEGSAEFQSDRTFRDQLACTVVDIHPNGVLVIEGSRQRIIAGETRTMRVRGKVRPDDIGLGNTIQSNVIADFKITYDGDGDATRYTKHGWLGRFTNKIWPW